jgi:hypothetical protein
VGESTGKAPGIVLNPSQQHIHGCDHEVELDGKDGRVHIDSKSGMPDPLIGSLPAVEP